MINLAKIIITSTVILFTAVPHSVAVTTEQILQFRLERIPNGLKDPKRAILFKAVDGAASQEAQAAKSKSPYFQKIHSNPNNVAIGYFQNGSLATSLKYQASDETPFFVYSVTKFVVGFLIADQVCQGRIDPTKKMGELSSDLSETAYRDIAFKDVLGMSSGVFSNANQQTVKSYQEVTRKGVSMMQQLSAQKKPAYLAGTKFDYSNYDSNALSFAVIGATGKTIAQLFETVVWENINPSYDGYWLKDSDGLPIGAFGLALSAGDLLKMGSFMVNRVRNEQCLKDYYTGEGEVDNRNLGIANWRKHSWVNPKNLNQFGGSGYGGQKLVFDTTTGSVVFVYSNYNDKYDENTFSIAWRLLDDLR